MLKITFHNYTIESYSFLSDKDIFLLEQQQRLQFIPYSQAKGGNSALNY